MTSAEDLGFSSERLGRLDAVLHKYVDDGKLPGVQTVISRHGEIAHRDVYGFTDVEAGTKVEEHSIYRIFSMTKPITSVALMMLFEEGHLLLENAVSRWIPSFADPEVWVGGSAAMPQTRPAERDVTVHDVLTHMSGLTYGFQFSHPVDTMYREHQLGDFGAAPTYDLEEGIDRLAQLPLLFDPGTSWNYSMSTDVCGRLVEAISGQTLDVFFRERIFEPLGMTDTGFAAPEDDVDRCAPLYIRGPKGLAPMAPARSMTKPSPFLSGGGGLVGTTDDYVRFAQFLLNGGELDGTRLLGDRTLAYMTTNHLPDGKRLNDMGQTTFSEIAMAGVGFGLGFSVIEDPAAVQNLCSAGEFGWGGAASTAFLVDPVEDLTAVFMTQLLPSDTYPLRRQLRNGMYQALAG